MMRGPTLLLLLLASFAPCIDRHIPCSAAEPWNWDQWRRLPVQDRGRQKPLDTMARETLRAIAHRQILWIWKRAKGSIPWPCTSKCSSTGEQGPIGWSLGWNLKSRSSRRTLPSISPISGTGCSFFMSTTWLCVKRWECLPARVIFPPSTLYRANMPTRRLGETVPFLQWIEQFESGRRRPVSVSKSMPYDWPPDCVSIRSIEWVWELMCCRWW